MIKSHRVPPPHTCVRITGEIRVSILIVAIAVPSSCYLTVAVNMLTLGEDGGKVHGTSPMSLQISENL